MHKQLVQALLVSQAAAAEWNYLTHGDDWGEGCVGEGLTNQTPINLSRPGTEDFARYPTIEGVQDQQSYHDQFEVPVNWNGHTSQVNLADNPEHGFISSIPKDYLGGENADLGFNAKQFHFHSPSEHTYDGRYFDLEMHTVHLSSEAQDSGFFAAALGIMFDVEDFTAVLSEEEQAVIDGFFDSLTWTDTETTPTAAAVPYGALVNMVDFDNRWVYQGSVTTPPCAQKVFWNQISTVYPIKQKHLDQFLAQLARKNDGVYAEKNLAEVGNYRAIQPEDLHNVHYVSNPNDERRREPTTQEAAPTVEIQSVVFDNNVPGVCTGSLTTTNRKTGENTGTGTINFNMNGDGTLSGSIAYDGGSPSVEGQYRFAPTDFAAQPDPNLFAFFDAPQTMYWTEFYDSGNYFYSGSLKADGTFEGFYNSVSDAPALLENRDADVGNSGAVEIHDVTCSISTDEAALASYAALKQAAQEKIVQDALANAIVEAMTEGGEEGAGETTEGGEEAGEEASEGGEEAAVECGARQRKDPQGGCHYCDDYTVISTDGMSCIAPDCAYNQVVVFDGTCQTCPMFNVADDTKRKCELPSCAEGQKISKEGKCTDCPPFTRSLSSNFRCDRQTCGTYKVLQEDGNCREPECTGNDFLNWDGECHPCPEYQTVNFQKKGCEVPICELNEMVTTEGKCNTCGPYQRVTTDQKSCAIMMCPTEQHVLNFDGSCDDPTIQENRNAELEASVAAKDAEIAGHLETINGIEASKIKQRYQIQSTYHNTKAVSQGHQYQSLLDAYSTGVEVCSMQEGTKGKIDFPEYEITEGVCSDGLLKYLYESRVITFNYDYKLKHQGVGCAPEKLNLGPTDTLDKCMKKYVDAIEEGKCDEATNAVEFVPNEHCDCCAPEYTIQLTDQDTNYEGYNIYQLLKNPVYLDGKPEVPLQQKAEMEFCEQLCSRDPACTAFEYDQEATGATDNCKLYTRQRYTGDGSAGILCFVKKATVSTEHLKMVKHNHFCMEHKDLSRETDNLEQCAARVVGAEECAEGQNVFFHRKYDKYCGCCTGANAIDEAHPTFDGDLNLYQRDTGVSACNPRNCLTCKAGDMNECAQCEEGYRLAFGACFNFEF